MATAKVAGPSPSMSGNSGGGPVSSQTHHHQQSHSHQPASPTTLDRLVRALLPESAFPTHIGDVHAREPSGSVTAGDSTAATSYTAGTASSHASTNKNANKTQAHSHSRSTPSPRKGLRAAVHRRNHSAATSSDTRGPAQTTQPTTSSSGRLTPSMGGLTRRRSRTEISHPPVTRSGSAASSYSYAGGIGESPAASHRSRQNSSSSGQSTNLASSMFSYRQSNSSGTQALDHNSSSKNALSSSAGAATLLPPHQNQPVTTAQNAGNSLPSIRGYTSFTDRAHFTSSAGAAQAQGQSGARPRTPLLDPFMRLRQALPSSSNLTAEGSQQGGAGYPSASTSGYAGVGAYPPRIGLSSDNAPRPEETSYVASLGLAPLVSRATQNGQPLYISGGRTPDTIHAAPSSTYSTPALGGFSPAMSSGGMQASPSLGGGTAPTASSSNAGLGVLKPILRHRSSSMDSYMRHPETGTAAAGTTSAGHSSAYANKGGETDSARRPSHARQQSDTAALSGLCSVRTSEDRPAHHHGSSSNVLAGFSLGRRKSRDTKPRSRKGSLSGTVRTGESAGTKFSSRFVRYDQKHPSFGMGRSNSTSPARMRSASFGAATAPTGTAQNTPCSAGDGAYRFPDQDSPRHPGIGEAARSADAAQSPGQQLQQTPLRGRKPRSRNLSRNNSASGSSSVDRRKEEHSRRNKLVSARLPPNVNHRDARMPSQPLGYTWVCGARSAARTPSFYEDFDYSAYPGGRRKRSISRNTLTSRSNSNAGQQGQSRRPSGPEDPNYESEPEYLSRARARNAGLSKVREQQQMQQGQPSDSPTENLQERHFISGVLAETPAHYNLSGGLLSAQEEKAIRRRSQSLVNLRQASKQRDAAGGMYAISSPFGRESSSELIRTPRAAPVPFPDDLQFSTVPPLFMGTSAVVPPPDENTLQRRGSRNRTHSGPAKASPPSMALPAVPLATGHVRRSPSRADIEAIEDLDKRREALFAALPPPTRRSPTPTPSSYFKAAPAPAPSGPLPNRPGDASPPVDDYSQYEASRVIIGQSDLISPTVAPERFPVVYGRALSTDQSHEGEILNASSSSEADDLSLALGRDTRDSRGSGQSLSPLTEAAHGSQSAGGSSENRSTSTGSARVLDMNEDSFTNLFYKAPPPSKPLPSVPSSGQQSQADSGSRGSGSPLIVLTGADQVQPSPVDEQNSPYRDLSDLPHTGEDRFPTPDFAAVESFFAGTAASGRSPRDSELYTHPYGSMAANDHAQPDEVIAAPVAQRAADEWTNIGDSALSDGRQIWPESRLRDDDDEERLVPPSMARNFTSSTAETVDTFYTVQGGQSGPSIASTSRFRAPSLEHQASFASARSHFTASSAARTVQGGPETPSLPVSNDRGQFIDADSEGEDEAEDRFATIRRTDMSPIYVARHPVQGYFHQHQPAYQQDQVITSAPLYPSQPPTARESVYSDENDDQRRSFIEFEPVVPSRERAMSDTRSFIEDDSDDEEAPLQTGSTAPTSSRTHAEHTHHPDVIVENAKEEADEDAQTTANASSAASPYYLTQANSPLSPASASGVASPSHDSLTPSDVIDSYVRHPSSGAQSTGSHYSLGIPKSPRSGDRSSGGSHAHSVSNVSLLSTLSRLEDFPEPPSHVVTPAVEKGENDAMKRQQPSHATLAQSYRSQEGLRARTGSLPAHGANPSRATLGTVGTSIYTFSSSNQDLGEGVGENHRNSQAESDVDNGDQAEQRQFEFPSRRTTPGRPGVDSFLDTSTSPERGLGASSTMPGMNSHIGFASGPSSPGWSVAQQEGRSRSPSQHHFRLSGIFGKRPKHERTWSDPSLVSRDSIMNRRDSGAEALESMEERRRSWRGI